MAQRKTNPGVPPTETPPAEDGIGGTGPREVYNPAKGWAAAPLVIIGLVVLLCVVGMIGFAASL
jgi:hypothetical protein